MQDEAMYSNSDFFRYSPHESEDSIEEDEEDSEEEEVRQALFFNIFVKTQLDENSQNLKTQPNF